MFMTRLVGESSVFLQTECLGISMFHFETDVRKIGELKK